MNGVRYPGELRDEAIRLYVDDQLSAAKVAARLGLKPYTVKDWLSKAGVIRTMSEAAALSARHAPRGRYGVPVRWSSVKTGRVEIADSTYEARRMSQLDLDDDVIDWRRCADRIPFVDHRGRKRLYIPDLEVVRRDGVSVEEIKPQRFLNDGNNQLKFEAARRFYAVKGIRFSIVTERLLGASTYEQFARYRADEAEARQRHSEKTKARRKTREAAETEDQRRDRLAYLAAKRQRQNAARTETPEQAEERRRQQRENHVRRVQQETADDRRARLDKRAAWARADRASKRNTTSMPREKGELP